MCRPISHANLSFVYFFICHRRLLLCSPLPFPMPIAILQLRLPHQLPLYSPASLPTRIRRVDQRIYHELPSYLKENIKEKWEFAGVGNSVSIGSKTRSVYLRRTKGGKGCVEGPRCGAAARKGEKIQFGGSSGSNLEVSLQFTRKRGSDQIVVRGGICGD